MSTEEIRVSTVLLPGNLPVAKKQGRSQETGPPEPPQYERVEFQAEPGFLARLDRLRRKRGLSRSAYIRQAVLVQMEHDSKGVGA